VAFGLIGGAGGAYWWFQPQLPSVNWSTVTNQWSVVKGKWSAITARLRRAPPPPPPPPHPRPLPPAPVRRQPPTKAQPAAPSPYATLDRRGDSLVLVVRNFGDRAALFDRKQLACAGLARGLVTVEERWVAYNAARRAAPALDRAHAVRDQRLYAGVDSVERRFERSGCERP